VNAAAFWVAEPPDKFTRLRSNRRAKRHGRTASLQQRYARLFAR
jgi:hypothetical protein